MGKKLLDKTKEEIDYNNFTQYMTKMVFFITLMKLLNENKK